MKFFIIFLTLFLQLTVKANVIKSSDHFKKVGEFTSFPLKLDRYKYNFIYDIFYYIPHTLKNSTNAKSLIFLHGGGDSSATRWGAINEIDKARGNLVRLAEIHGFILVMPSSNGLQWSGHTRGLLRDLATLMRKELMVDPNLIGVSGHSMGGMGITRSYQYGADEFAFYMPMASGVDTTKKWMWNDEFLYKVFNVPYVQLQGNRDFYDVFVKRNMEHLKRIKKMEEKYGEKSKFQVNFYDGGHSYNFQLASETLKILFENPRDLYQKSLYGSFYTANFERKEHGYTYNMDSEARYFWMELFETDLTEAEEIHFKAKIVGQEIQIEMTTIPKMSRKLRVYLSEKMLDLSKEIKILINDQEVLNFSSQNHEESNFDENDPAFLFNDFVDIDLTKLD